MSQMNTKMDSILSARSASVIVLQGCWPQLVTANQINQCLAPIKQIVIMSGNEFVNNIYAG